MRRIVAGAVFAGVIAAGVAITAGAAVADNGVIHMEGTGSHSAAPHVASATPDATAIEYAGLGRVSRSGCAHGASDATA
ncbi:hypothetical protein DFR76_101821 [Nocardia pseudobrasiliensis]|uniref:Uncharacterized protein n=1 Tax=Nocardia pseudobrasiliensis TaxID=45979 RepID=A0A370IF09_9NOCA|nr:hypothetical protein DFR76_101821 [Nocardia pseudobrasiliensis]